jgi:hypothetical protein
MREAPHWLYERLPYLYVLIGALAASDFRLQTESALGIALVLVGLVVLRLRNRYRLKSTQHILFRLGALR